MRVELTGPRKTELPALGDRMKTRCNNIKLSWLIVPGACIGLRSPSALEVEPRPPVSARFAEDILTFYRDRHAAAESKPNISATLYA